eukprot:TRINITY_DN11205_c0_g1_i1.p1 TRINITY_DN11205_c0_g1~~TRINITY_DN11205_c0_g1_i1.p1  ORF type:complete len:150 (-),score=19.86 TRINITY_DN11205_c0_g1_i1:309-758(-)
MEAANKAILDKAYEHFRTSDIQALLAMMSDDFHYTPPDAFRGWGPDMKHSLSKDEFAPHVLVGFAGLVKDFKFAPEACGPMGTTEGGLCPGCYTFIDTTNGDRPVSSRTVHRWMIKDGLLTGLHNYFDGQLLYEVYMRLHPEYRHPPAL